MYRSVRSETSFKLYIVAAALLFIQSGLAFGIAQSVQGGMTSLGIGALFLVGAAMAKIGFGIAKRTERSVGGGWYVSTVETADAIMCGCMTGLAVLILTGVQIAQAFRGGNPGNAAIAIPGILAGFVAIAAGIVALRQRIKEGAFERPAPTPAVEVPPDSRTCPYCKKVGISPQAVSCPSCGQPLD